MQSELMGMFGFDEEDLSSNRGGMLSPKQEKTNKELRTFGNRVAVVLTLVVLGATIFCARQALITSPTDQAVPLWIGAGLGVLASLWMIRSLFTKVDESLQKAEGKLKLVKSVTKTGSVTDSEVDRRSVDKYEMVVGGTWFGVDPATFTALLEKEDDRFAVYYTMATKRILSVEYLGPAEEAEAE